MARISCVGPEGRLGASKPSPWVEGEQQKWESSTLQHTGEKEEKEKPWDQALTGMHRLPPQSKEVAVSVPKTSSGSAQVLLHSAGQERERAEDPQPQEMLYSKVLYLHLKCFEWSCSASCSWCQPRRFQGERQCRGSPHKLQNSTCPCQSLPWAVGGKVKAKNHSQRAETGPGSEDSRSPAEALPCTASSWRRIMPENKSRRTDG